jgi:hypothetical protein
MALGGGFFSIRFDRRVRHRFSPCVAQTRKWSARLSYLSTMPETLAGYKTRRRREAIFLLIRSYPGDCQAGRGRARKPIAATPPSEAEAK